MRVVVVGAGVVGLAAAFELSRAGHDVTVLTADLPGSRQSAGLGRIFRFSHADGPLTDAAARSLELWEEWEALAGHELLDRVGLLLTGDMSDREPFLAPYGGLEELTGAVHPLAVPQDRWLRERTGGASRAEDTIRFLQSALDDVRLEAVLAVSGGGVTIGGERVEADRVVVCAGPETYGLMGRPAPERVRSVRFSFALREPLPTPAPCWIQRDDALCEPFYAAPDGADHYSIGLSRPAPIAVPEAEHIREAHGRITEIVRRVFPGLVPVAERLIACEYTLNPHGPLTHDGWDLLEHAGVIGLAGPTLFKFAPLLGRLVAERLSV